MQYKVNTLKTIIALLFFFHFTYGQEGQKLSIGIQSGVGGAMWYNEPIAQKKSRSRMSFLEGVKVRYVIKPFIVLCLDANYERKGASLDGSKATLIDNNTINSSIFFVPTYMDYITFPIAVKLTTYNKKVNCFASIGTYAGYLLKIGTQENPNNYNRFDIGLINGLGFDIPIKKHFQFSIEVRNNLGLLNFSKANNHIAKNESFAFLLGLSYVI